MTTTLKNFTLACAASMLLSACTTSSCWTPGDSEAAHKVKYGNPDAAHIMAALNPVYGTVKVSDYEKRLDLAKEGLQLDGINNATKGDLLWTLGQAYTGLGDDEKARQFKQQVIDEQLYRYSGHEKATKFQDFINGTDEARRNNVDEFGRKKGEPLVRIPPFFPPRATRSGHCEVVFDLTKDGTPVNVRTTYCTDSIFKQATITAAQKWKYRPQVVDGKAVASSDYTTKLRLRLSDECGGIIPEI